MRTAQRTSLIVATSLLLPTLARADWPMAQHDPRRTGAATGVSRLEHPASVWRRYLGGALQTGQLIATDAVRAGQTDVVLVSSGRLQARRADDTPIWETGQFGVGGIVAIRDLNGDGEQDIVTYGVPGFVGVFGARDGRLEWRSTPGTFGPNVGTIHATDFNGDGLLDLYVSDLGCGTSGSLGDFAYAYSFGQGFGSGHDDAATRLWALEHARTQTCSVADVVADFTGDGRPDVVTFSSQQAWLYDGTTGRVISSGNEADDVRGAYDLGLSTPYGVMLSDVRDIEGDGRPEIVGYTDNAYDPSVNSRLVFVVDYDPARPQATRLRTRWHRDVASLTADRHVFVQNSAADLDRDGDVEIVSTFVSGGTTAVTYIRNGSDGSVLAEIPGATIAGVYDLGEDQPRTVVLRRGTNLEGYRFAAFGGAVPAPAFRIDDADVVTQLSLDAPRGGSAARSQSTVADPDGVHRALVVLSHDRLQVWSVQGAAPSRVAEYDPGGVAITTVAGQSNIGRPGAGLLVARSDGTLLALDGRLQVLDLGATERPFIGIRTGGYYTGGCGSLDAPVAARFDGTTEAVVARDSRGVLLRLDAATASNVVPPRLEWEWPGAATPVLIDVDGDGRRDILATSDARGPQGARALTARSADGATDIWSRDVTEQRTEFIYGDVVPLAGAGLRFALGAVNFGDGNGRVYVVDARGATVANTAPLGTIASGQGRIAALDVDTDGRDDAVIMMINSLRAYSGDSGAQLAGESAAQGQFVGMPIVTRGSTGAVDLIGGASLGPIGGYSLEPTGAAPPFQLTQRWTLPGTAQRTGCFGAVLRCPDGLRFATGSVASPHLAIADATTGAVRTEFALTAGQLFATDAEARAMTGIAALLGNVSATSALYANTPAFVVGGSDGYLYAVDACATTPRLLWALNFSAPVGQPVFADTDGDGEDEIVVSSADGYVHGVDTERFAAPSFVYDTDPEHGVPDADVDEIRGLAVHALWSPVPGALSYEWALYTAAGEAVTHRPGAPSNPFLPAGATETRADVREGLAVGMRYVFAVRALGPDGASSEAISDGVRILPDDAPGDAGPDAGPDAAPDSGNGGVDAADGGPPRRPILTGGGCGHCAVGGTASRATGRSTWLALGAVALGLARARRRAARRRATH